MKTPKKSDAPLKAEINPVDLYVGSRVRLRRKFLDISQESLAGAIELTFQQVQKYERGTNRISASKLYEISKKLKVPIAYFFEGYDADSASDEPQSEQVVQTFLMTAEGIELAKHFPNIKKPRLKRKVLDLMQALGETDKG